MCGILGVRRSWRDDPAAFRRAVAAMAWRGPDGTRVLEVDDWRLAVARLAISDPGNDQPIADPDGRMVALFNGAVTSAAEEWRRHGASARTRNDAELALLRLRQAGETGFVRTSGPCGAAVLDLGGDRLWLLRDRAPAHAGRRWLGGVRYERDTFETIADETLAAPLPANRKFVYPWAGLEMMEDDFQTTHDQDQLVRTEDLKCGRSLRAELGLAAPAWGSDQAAAMFALYGDAGRRLDEAQSLFFTGGLNGRWESDGLRDVLLQGETRYYRRQRPNLLFYADARVAVAQSLDLDHQLLLGGDNGLRGYPLRYQCGTASALLTGKTGKV